MDSNDNNRDRKHCKCNKSNCLKLYCECFADGWYCDKSCACQDCYNSLDYEDTVDMAREKIQSRKPLAFEPFVDLTTAAGKRLKGCNCVKSMCMKLYCDCYKAMVGCSGQCGCKQCCNVYGKREAFPHIVKKKMKSVETRFPLHKFHYPRNLTSSTPFLQSVHENGTATTEFHNPLNLTSLTGFEHLSRENNPSTTGRYLPSLGSANFDMNSLNHQSFPGAEFHNPHSHSLTPWTPFGHLSHDSTITTPERYITSSDSINHAMMVGTSRGSSDMDQQSYPNVESLNQFTLPDSRDIHVGNPTFITNDGMKNWPNESITSGNPCAESFDWPASLFGGQQPQDVNEDNIPIIQNDYPSFQYRL